MSHDEKVGRGKCHHGPSDYSYEDLPDGMARVWGPDLPAVIMPAVLARQFCGLLEAWGELPRAETP